MKKIQNDIPIRLDSPRVWRTYTGGKRLGQLHGSLEEGGSQYPEEWIMSVVAARNSGCTCNQEEGMSRLPDYENRTLKELIESAPSYYLGRQHAENYGSQPGVLVKLIDSAERLTVQVHPDKEKAHRLFQSEFGKTECWHILDDTPVHGVKPCVYIGFKPGITLAKWKSLFERQDIPGMLEAMHRIEVKKGDTILIEGGVPHAIGESCFLMEIQEPTDYTIRVERMTPAGFMIDDRMCHQGLGFEKMFECFSYEGITREEAMERWFINPVIQKAEPGGEILTLVGYKATPFFCLEKIKVTGAVEIENASSFSGIYVLKGRGTLICTGGKTNVRTGEQYFLPAGVGKWNIEADEGEMLTLMHFMGPY